MSHHPEPEKEDSPDLRRSRPAAANPAGQSGYINLRGSVGGGQPSPSNISLNPFQRQRLSPAVLELLLRQQAAQSLTENRAVRPPSNNVYNSQPQQHHSADYMHQLQLQRLQTQQQSQSQDALLAQLLLQRARSNQSLSGPSSYGQGSGYLSSTSGGSASSYASASATSSSNLWNLLSSAAAPPQPHQQMIQQLLPQQPLLQLPAASSLHSPSVMERLLMEQQLLAAAADYNQGGAGAVRTSSYQPLSSSNLQDVHLPASMQPQPNLNLSTASPSRKRKPEYDLKELRHSYSLNASLPRSPIAAPRFANDKIVPMAVPSDKLTLSHYQCLVREQIIFFAASSDDISSSVQGRNRPIVLGQVGIHCRHCWQLFRHPASVNRSGRQPKVRGVLYYPAKSTGIYQAAQNMVTNHFMESCRTLPADVRAQLMAPRNSSSSGEPTKRSDQKHISAVGGGGKQYWASAAEALGIRESEEVGLVFDHNLV